MNTCLNGYGACDPSRLSPTERERVAASAQQRQHRAAQSPLFGAAPDSRHYHRGGGGCGSRGARVSPSEWAMRVLAPLTASEAARPFSRTNRLTVRTSTRRGPPRISSHCKRRPGTVPAPFGLEISPPRLNVENVRFNQVGYPIGPAPKPARDLTRSPNASRRGHALGRPPV